MPPAETVRVKENGLYTLGTMGTTNTSQLAALRRRLPEPESETGQVAKKQHKALAFSQGTSPQGLEQSLGLSGVSIAQQLQRSGATKSKAPLRVHSEKAFAANLHVSAASGGVRKLAAAPPRRRIVQIRHNQLVGGVDVEMINAAEILHALFLQKKKVEVPHQTEDSGDQKESSVETVALFLSLDTANQENDISFLLHVPRRKRTFKTPRISRFKAKTDPSLPPQGRITAAASLWYKQPVQPVRLSRLHVVGRPEMPPTGSPLGQPAGGPPVPAANSSPARPSGVALPPHRIGSPLRQVPAHSSPSSDSSPLRNPTGKPIVRLGSPLQRAGSGSSVHQVGSPLGPMAGKPIARESSNGSPARQGPARAGPREGGSPLKQADAHPRLRQAENLLMQVNKPSSNVGTKRARTATEGGSPLRQAPGRPSNVEERKPSRRILERSMAHSGSPLRHSSGHPTSSRDDSPAKSRLGGGGGGGGAAAAETGSPLRYSSGHGTRSSRRSSLTGQAHLAAASQQQPSSDARQLSDDAMDVTVSGSHRRPSSPALAADCRGEPVVPSRQQVFLLPKLPTQQDSHTRSQQQAPRHSASGSAKQAVTNSTTTEATPMEIDVPAPAPVAVERPVAASPPAPAAPTVLPAPTPVPLMPAAPQMMLATNPLLPLMPRTPAPPSVPISPLLRIQNAAAAARAAPLPAPRPPPTPPMALVAQMLQQQQQQMAVAAQNQFQHQFGVPARAAIEHMAAVVAQPNQGREMATGSHGEQQQQQAAAAQQAMVAHQAACRQQQRPPAMEGHQLRAALQQVLSTVPVMPQPPQPAPMNFGVMECLSNLLSRNAASSRSGV